MIVKQEGRITVEPDGTLTITDFYISGEDGDQTPPLEWLNDYAYRRISEIGLAHVQQFAPPQKDSQ